MVRRPHHPLLLAAAVVTLSTPARAEPPPGPAGLRVVSLNVATLHKTEGGALTAGDSQELAAVRNAYRRLLSRQDVEAADRGEVVVFAVQEATGVEPGRGNCLYTPSPYGSVQEGLAAAGAGYQSRFQSWHCRRTLGNGTVERVGFHGNDLLTNAAIDGYAETPLPNVDHAIGTQAIKVRFGAADDEWIWVVNVHFETEPLTALHDFLETIEWLEETAPDDWERLPVLILGDFNIAADGRDTRVKGTDWGTGAASGEHHAAASTALELLLEHHEFAHVVGREPPTFRAWKPVRRVDYAVLRNPPEPAWISGHLLHPTDTDGSYWTDHLGLVVTVRRPPADQIWLVTSR